MPRVPTYDNFQTSISQAPRAQFQAPSGPTGDAIAANSLSQTGQAFSQAGGAMAKMALDAATQANQVRVDEALNQLKERQLHLTYDKADGFQGLRGRSALDRPEGKSLEDEFAGKLSEDAARAAASLGNDEQRRLFTMHANGMVSSFRGQAMAHESTQFKEYHSSVAESTVATAQREIALRYDNPDSVSAAVSRISGNVYELARLQGKPAEWADNMARKMASNAHTLALGAALDAGKLDYAQGYLKKFGGQMDADDLLRVQGQVTKEMQGRQVLSAVDQVWGMARPEVAPNDFDRVVAITLKTESNGKRYGSDGKSLLTSSAGAKGEMQVLDGTNMDPGFGVKPAKDNSPDERARVGRDYLAAMVRRYDGDLSKAWAAYNGGPGRVDQALKDAGAGRSGSGDWLSYMPKESRDYVAKNVAAYNAPAKAAPGPDVETLTARALAAVPDATPEQRQRISAEVVRRVETHKRAVKERGDAATADAFQRVAQAGGDLSVLTASERQAIPGEDLPRLMSFAKSIAAGVEPETNMAVYARLSDPAMLRGTSEADLFRLRTQLSNADFRHFVNERQKLVNPGASKGAGPGDLNGAVKQVLDERMRVMGQDPSPKDGSSDAQRVGAIRQTVNTSVLAAQAASGKQMSDAEVAAHIDGLMAKSVTFRGLFSNSSKPVLAVSFGDIPRAERDAIKSAFKRQGIDSPSDGQVLSVWMTKQQRAGADTTGSY